MALTSQTSSVSRDRAARARLCLPSAPVLQVLVLFPKSPIPWPLGSLTAVSLLAI